MNDTFSLSSPDLASSQLLSSVADGGGEINSRINFLLTTPSDNNDAHAMRESYMRHAPSRLASFDLNNSNSLL